SIDVSISETRKTRTQKIDAPTAEHQSLAAQLGLDCAGEFLEYVDHFQAKGKPHADQVAGFRNWLRNAAKFSSAKPVVNGPRGALSLADRRAANMAKLTGRSDERTIEGSAQRSDDAAIPALRGDVR